MVELLYIILFAVPAADTMSILQAFDLKSSNIVGTPNIEVKKMISINSSFSFLF